MAWVATLVAVAAFAGNGQTMDLERMANGAAEAALNRFAKEELKRDEIGISIGVREPDAKTYRFGAYRGDDEMYPASVVKLCYLSYLAHLLDAKTLTSTPEIERATHDMIVDSDNDATNWILELVTGAASGPELSPGSLKRWMAKRQAVNRWFKSRGYKQINACQKTWYSGPYGRERQGYGANWELRNSMTPNECGRLMAEIMEDKIVSPARSEWMRTLLHRLPPSETKQPNDQASEFVGKVLPAGWKLWSKAGWTNTVRHDVAAIEAPDGKRYILSIFTKSHSGNPAIIQTIARDLLGRLGYTPLAE